jgi:hypothetical protein
MKAKIGIISVALLILSGCAFFGGEKIFTPPSAIRYRLVSDCYLVRNTSLKQSCEVLCDTDGHLFSVHGLPRNVSKASIGKQYGRYTVVGILPRAENVGVVGIEMRDSFEMGRFRVPIVTISAACDGCSRITGAQIADLSTGEIRPEVAIRVP